MDAAIELPRALRVARYRFDLRLEESVLLPPFKGSTLRGGLGSVLRRISCYRSGADCAQCGLDNDCVYGYLFRTTPPADAAVLSNYTEVARPYVIEPPLTRQERFEAGERLSFGVVLIGRGIDYFPYLIVAVQELGRTGLGRTRGRFTVEGVTMLGPDGQATVLDGGEGIVHSPSLALEATKVPVPEGADGRAVVTFVTPTRLKYGGDIVREGPPFHVLGRALLGRVSSLAYFHGGEQWAIDFRGWIDRADAVSSADLGAGWSDWGRYSGRQGQRVRMGGLLGRATYEGAVEPYLPLLALGTWVHVGKGAVFGNGAYEVRAG